MMSHVNKQEHIWIYLDKCWNRFERVWTGSGEPTQNQTIGSVQRGSGSNLGSEPNQPITTTAYVTYKTM